MTAEAEKPHVLMVVNNPGSNDLRVVKQAEEIVRLGGCCTVLGIHRAGYPVQEIINGVSFVRVRLVYSFLAILLGFFPRSISVLSKKKLKSKRTSNKGPKPTHPKIRRNDKNKSFENDSRLLFKIIRFIRGAIVKVIFKVPLLQPLAIRVRQGAYLNAFYSVIFDSTADIVQSHELAPLESCVLGARGRRIIYDSHELEIHRNSLLSKRSKRLIERYERKYINDVHKVFAVSEGCAAQLMHEYGLDDVGLLMNCPLLRMQRAAENSLRETLSLRDDTPLIVYTGSITFNRGIDKIIASLPYIPSYHFVCVGPSSSPIQKSLIEDTEKLGVRDRFHIVDKVAPEILISFISSADVAVIPIQDVCLSYRYCLPNKIFEAMHAGLAILASDLPDMARLVKKENIGFVSEMVDPKAIATAIQKVYMAKAEFFCHCEIENLRERYSFEREMKKLMRTYFD